jgi:uncharacterized SAM-binding protein YcdF (DUF218 family)
MKENAINIILVLGNGIQEIVDKRLDRAIEEYNKFRTSFEPDELREQSHYIMVSGCGKKKSHEYMYSYLISKKINPKFIIVEGKSMTTLENLIFSFGILEEMFQNNISLWTPLNIIVCTSSFHIKRSILLTKLLNKPNFTFEFIHTREIIPKELDQHEANLSIKILDEFSNHLLEDKLICS